MGSKAMLRVPSKLGQRVPKSSEDELDSSQEDGEASSQSVGCSDLDVLDDRSRVGLCDELCSDFLVKQGEQVLLVGTHEVLVVEARQNVVVLQRGERLCQFLSATGGAHSVIFSDKEGNGHVRDGRDWPVSGFFTFTPTVRLVTFNEAVS